MLPHLLLPTQLNCHLLPYSLSLRFVASLMKGFMMPYMMGNTRGAERKYTLVYSHMFAETGGLLEMFAAGGEGNYCVTVVLLFTNPPLFQSELLYYSYTKLCTFVLHCTRYVTKIATSYLISTWCLWIVIQLHIYIYHWWIVLSLIFFLYTGPRSLLLVVQN